MLHLGTSFEAGSGPKFHVWLVPEAAVTPDTQVQETRYADLGRLKAFAGSRNYPIFNGAILDDYNSVVVR